MAIYSLHTKIISRSSGRSSIGASAYRSGEKLSNERDGLIHDYTKRKDVIHKEIIAPDNAPGWANDREKLWNEVEKIEKSKDSQLAREVMVALPKELDHQQQIELVREYSKNNFVKDGMVVDFAIHDKGEGNPHAHIMLTMRPFEKDGSWGTRQKKEYILDKDGNKQYDSKKKTYKCRTIKSTEWDSKETLEKWRENWANVSNKHLEKAGYKERIDHRSYEEQGIEKVPSKHMGVKAAAMENRGIETERGNINREIDRQNEQLKEISKKIEEYKKELLEIQEREKAEEQRKLEDRQKEEITKEEQRKLEDRRKTEERKRLEEQKNKHPRINTEVAKEEYLKALKFDEKIEKYKSNLSSEIQKTNSNLEELKQAKKELENYERNLENLREEHKNTSFIKFGKKKELEKEIQAQERRIGNIQENYGIKNSRDLEDPISKLEENQKVYTSEMGQLKEIIDKNTDRKETVLELYKLGMAQDMIEEYKQKNYTEKVLEEHHTQYGIHKLENAIYNEEINLIHEKDNLKNIKALEGKIERLEGELKKAPLLEKANIRKDLEELKIEKQNFIKQYGTKEQIENKVSLAQDKQEQRGVVKTSLKDRLNAIKTTKKDGDRITLKDVEKIAPKLTEEDRGILIKVLKQDSEKSIEKSKYKGMER